MKKGLPAGPPLTAVPVVPAGRPGTGHMGVDGGGWVGAVLGRLGPPGGARDYILAILLGVLAVLVRAALDPFLQSDHAFVLGLLAVVFVSWQCGF